MIATMRKNWKFRAAEKADASDLAVLIDISSRGLLSWLWREMAPADQSPMEFGRERIRVRDDLPAYYSNWQIATLEGAVVGAMAGYTVPLPYDPGDISDLPSLYQPLLEVEALAAGTWHLMSLAVYADYRGTGVGTQLLMRAEDHAQSCGCSTISIIANSANSGACRLYKRAGYTIQARRPYVPYPGSEYPGEWLLFQKLLGEC